MHTTKKRETQKKLKAESGLVYRYSTCKSQRNMHSLGSQFGFSLWTSRRHSGERLGLVRVEE